MEDEQKPELPEGSPKPPKRRRRTQGRRYDKSNLNKKFLEYPEANLKERWEAKMAELKEAGMTHQAAFRKLYPETSLWIAKAKEERKIIVQMARKSTRPERKQELQGELDNVRQAPDTVNNEPENVNLIRDYLWTYANLDHIPDFSKAPSMGCRQLWTGAQDRDKGGFKDFMTQLHRILPETKTNDRAGETQTIIQLLESLKKAEVA